MSEHTIAIANKLAGSSRIAEGYLATRRKLLHAYIREAVWLLLLLGVLIWSGTR